MVNIAAAIRSVLRALFCFGFISVTGCSQPQAHVTVDERERHQIMAGWEVTARVWEFDKANDRLVAETRKLTQGNAALRLEQMRDGSQPFQPTSLQLLTWLVWHRRLRRTRAHAATRLHRLRSRRQRQRRSGPLAHLCVENVVGHNATHLGEVPAVPASASHSEQSFATGAPFANAHGICVEFLVKKPKVGTGPCQLTKPGELCP